MFAFIAFITLAFGIVVVGEALAGEKHKLSAVYYTTKWEPMNVPGEEGHVICLWEAKGITRNKEGKPFGEGLAIHSVGHLDMNTKAGICSGYFYEEFTDRDGDKFYNKSAGTMKTGKLGPYWEGTMTFTRGTGKYEGIRGEAPWKNYPVGLDQSYADWEVNVELPR